MAYTAALIWLSTSEWPNSARAVIAVVLGAVAFVGFSESIRWVNARENFVLSQVDAKTDKRAEIRAKLQECYVDVGPLIARQFSRETPADDFSKYIAEADAWVNNCANWIAENMGVPARERFLDRTGMISTSYSGALNAEHNTAIQNLTRLRQNLLVLIESGVWDKPNHHKPE